MSDVAGRMDWLTWADVFKALLRATITSAVRAHTLDCPKTSSEASSTTCDEQSASHEVLRAKERRQYLLLLLRRPFPQRVESVRDVLIRIE